MEALSSHKLASTLASLANKPVLYVAFVGDDPAELLQAAPYLSLEEHGQFVADGGGCILCDCEKEMQELYDQTVGDDGPTKLNSYDGPMRVYACTIRADGEIGTENT